VGGARGRCPVGGAPWEVPKVSPWDLRASRAVGGAVGGAKGLPRGRCQRSPTGPREGAPREVPKVSPWDLRASREVQKEVPQALL
jgi:hypothetical protein